MTVSELIEKLSEFPPNMSVLDERYEDIHWIEKENYPFFSDNIPSNIRETEFVVIR